LAQLYPSFTEGATFFHLALVKIREFFKHHGGLDPLTGRRWLTDIAYHHLAITILLITGHMFKPN